MERSDDYVAGLMDARDAVRKFAKDCWMPQQKAACERIELMLTEMVNDPKTG